jgi:hypothetical protein
LFLGLSLLAYKGFEDGGDLLLIPSAWLDFAG